MHHLGLVGLVLLAEQQIVVLQTVVLKVSGSNPSGGVIFFLAYLDMSSL